MPSKYRHTTMFPWYYNIELLINTIYPPKIFVSF